MFERKKNKKQEETQLTTLEQIRKAYEDLSDDDKKSFHQSLSDRIHESIAAQERADGNEDSQSAEAREHEALGEEHAEGEGNVSELHESDDTVKEKREDKRDDDREDDFKNSILNRLSELEKRFSEAKKTEESKEEWADRVYGVGDGVFGDSKEHSEKQMTPAEIARVIAKIKG